MNRILPSSRGLVVALLVLVVLGSAGSLAVASSTTDWPAPRHDGANTGSNLEVTAPTGDVGPAWMARVGTAVEGEVSPTVGDGTVYVGNDDGVVFAFTTEGEREWRSNVGGSVRSAVVLDGTFGYVIVRDADTDMVELVAVDRADGNVAWRYTLTADRPYSALRGQPTVVDGTVYVRGEAFGPEADPERYLVAVEDGTERWRFQAGDDDITSPAVVDGRVYVGTHDPGAETGRVLALDVADGNVAWETDLATEAASAPVVSDGGVYVATWSDVTVFDAVDGTVTRRLPVAAGGEPIAVADGTVYAVRDEDDTLVAVDATSGETRWTAAEQFVETPPIVTSDAVVIGANGVVTGLDRTTGQREWAYLIDERGGLGSDLAVVDGAVYVGPTNGRLYALVEGGSARPGGVLGLLGQLGGGVASDTGLGFVTAIGTASILAGLVAGTVVLGLVWLRSYSLALPRLLAGRVLRRPYEAVGTPAAVAAHLSLSVVVLFVLGGLYLGGSILLTVFGAPGVPLLGGGPLYVGALLLVTLPIAWAVLTYWWLPAAAELGGDSLRSLRRQAAVVLVTYTVVAGVLYPLLLFVVLMLVFFR